MALPVITNVRRVSLIWNPANGVRPVNVFHVRCASGTDDDIFSAIETGFTHTVSGQVCSNLMFKPLSNARTCIDVEIIKLDGTSATTAHRLATSISGTTGGEELPACAAVLSMHTDRRGARGRGRQFIGPITESGTNAGILAAATPGDMVLGWESFASSLDGATVPVELGVASYVHRDFNVATSFSVRPQIGTQRRRQDQLV